MSAIQQVLAAMGGSAPRGQRTFTSAGTHTVSAGVTTVCVVCIGAGSQNNGADGAGGALSYINGLSVTPGESLTVEFQTTGSQRYVRLLRGGTELIRANSAVSGSYGASTAGGGVVSYSGGSGGGSGGGSAGTYTAAGNSDVDPTQGSSLHGPGGTNKIYGRGSCPSNGSVGASGLRIVWGTGRAFPNTDVSTDS